MKKNQPPLRILIAALGGEGGGVLMNWVLAATKAAGMTAQSTSVPGVAQRTGSTSYYIEIADPKHSPNPVLNLVPMPARVDVVLVSELVEAARCLAAGFVSPNLTTLIASTSRVYSTAEKIELGDGRYSKENIRKAAKKMAKKHYLLDLQELATDNATFISATLYGALAGSGALPWSDEISKSVFGKGPSAAASIRGYSAAFDAVKSLQGAPASILKTIEKPFPKVIEPDADQKLPQDLQVIIDHGHDRVVDFQDAEYGKTYLNYVSRLTDAVDVIDTEVAMVITESARRLALWMAYEDIARVADLKTRSERFDKIRDEAHAKPGQIVWVTEYMKPRAEEIADILPQPIGKWVMKRVEKGGWFPFLGRGRYIRSNGVFGYWMLRMVAATRHIRRRSLRFSVEQFEISQWVNTMEHALARDTKFAAGLAELPRVLKGYSDTHLRGKAAYSKINNGVVQPALKRGAEATSAAYLRQVISAALADEDHVKLDALLSENILKVVSKAKIKEKSNVH